jgi:Calx-beta domain
MMDNIRQLMVSGRRSLGERFLGETRGSERKRRTSVRWTANLEPLERRELLSTTQDFNTPGTGTPFTTQQFGDAPGPTLVSLSATDRAMQITDGGAVLPNQNNQLSFDRSDAGTYNQVNATFDFQIIPGTGRGNGLSFALLNTANFGTTGAATQSPSPPKALFTGSLGIGFDTSAGTGDVSDNFVVISFNRNPVQEFPIDKTVLDLANGNFITAAISVNFVTSNVSFALGLTGSTTPAYSNSLVVAGLAPYESRVNYTGTAVSTLATMTLDNVNVVYSGFRQPGSISFSSASYTVAENAGSAAIDVIRTGGAAGSFTVFFVSADGTARNGVNYTSITQSVTFAENQTDVTVSLPIIDDHVFNGNKTVKLFLSNPTLQASLTPPIQATLTIVESDSAPPTVSSTVQLVFAPHTRRVIAFRLSFSQSMELTSAQNLANYQVLLPPAHKNSPKRVVPLSRAVLDPSGTVVTLYRASLGQHLTKLVQILVRGTPTTGLMNTSGTFLAGSGGVAGTNALLKVSV